ncbi:hypothetical protein DSO57_1020575 [Entomophthora muscae]|uniref:Uncharacterized protein n=1 Tax=Entomophthora muscae TaxID=34485 RepID=A0ACC2U1T6_9FUNG|nr:hypothetical protein DSO57_1020575 [Entomophthora muscae]
MKIILALISLSLCAGSPGKGHSIVASAEANPYFSAFAMDTCPICSTFKCEECTVPLGQQVAVRNTRVWSKILLRFNIPAGPISKCLLQLQPVANQPQLSTNTIVDIHLTLPFNPANVTWNSAPKSQNLITNFDIKSPHPIDLTPHCLSSRNLFLAISKNDVIGPEIISFHSSISSHPPTLIIS